MSKVSFFEYNLNNLNLKELYNQILNEKNEDPKIINCMNPHSFVVSKKDKIFSEALSNGYVNLIDGVGVSFYLSIKKLSKINRITGYDLFEKIVSQKKNLKLFFLGSTEKNLDKIKTRIKKENPQMLVETYSPPFKEYFSDEENEKILDKINTYKPDYLFVGMTAPKQEKWSYLNKNKVKSKFILNVGAVFDYYAGSHVRPFKLIRDIGLEWLFRLFQNPRLMHRTIISLPIYFFYILKEIFYAKTKFTINIIDNIQTLNKKINTEKKFIFSAFNLAMTSNLIRRNIENEKSFIFWSDGIFCKFFNRKIKKIAGNEFLENISLESHYKRIHVIGNLQELGRSYLNNKFSNLELIFTKLPFSSVENLIQYIPEIKEDSLVLITIPTPKQELFSQHIMSKYKFAKIICIGGGLSIASGYEKKCPKILEKIGLEFIWRLRNETKRRSLRLLRDFVIMLFSFLTLRLKKFSVSKNDK